MQLVRLESDMRFVQNFTRTTILCTKNPKRKRAIFIVLLVLNARMLMKPMYTSALLFGIISSPEIVGCGSIWMLPSGYLFSFILVKFDFLVWRLRNKKCAAFYICCTPLTLTLSDPARVCVARLCCVVDLFSECGHASTMFTCTSRLFNRPFLYSISVEYFSMETLHLYPWTSLLAVETMKLITQYFGWV